MLHALRRFPLVFVSVLAFASIATAQTLYVDADATGVADGSSWFDAFTDLQSALDAAPAEGDVIWIAAGTYTPTDVVGGTGFRYRTFVLKNGVAVYGGFAGIETLLSERDPAQNVVVLSGDIGVPGDVTDNCYHVFYHGSGSGLDETAVLDGVTISGGYGDVAGGDNRRGGGMYNEDASPSLIGCIFEDNASVGGSYCYGGGLYNEDASPLVIDCIFRRNLAGRSGGAMVNFNSSAPIVRGCLFEDNEAGLPQSGNGDAGAVYNSGYCEAVFTDCTFVGNRANYNGGAMCISGSSTAVSVVGCLFQDNTSGTAGGAIRNDSANPTFTQCVFTGNTATAGNAHGGVIYNQASDPVFTNCVLYDNESGCVGNGIYNNQFSDTEVYNSILSGSDVVWNNSNCTTTVMYSNIQQAGFDDPALHNISSDPRFEDPDNGDFRLSDISPCIDAGSNPALPADIGDVDGDDDRLEILPLDFFGNLRRSDDSDTPDTGLGTSPIVDMGVHEIGGGTSSVPEMRTAGLWNHPNPFNPSTTIEFELGRDGVFSLDVYDVQGRLVRSLLDGTRPAGAYRIVWDGRDDSGRSVASGTYFGVLRSVDGTSSRKLTIAK